MIVSPSAVIKAYSCFRLWGFGGVHGIWAEQKKFGADGDVLHGYVENRVRYGQKFPVKKCKLARVAALADPYLPTRLDEPLVEEEALVPYAHHQLKVKPDLIWPGVHKPVVMDHKSVNHFGFMMNGPKLRGDFQACSYALRAMLLYKVDEVNLLWAYYRRPQEGDPDDYEPKLGKDLRFVDIDIDMDDVASVLRQYMPLIDEMERAKANKLPIADMACNRNHCPKFGGCGYKERCPD